MPLATPVWLAGTASTMMLDIAEKASPKPAPSSADRDEHLPDLGVRERHDQERGDADRRAGDQHGLGAEAGRQRTGQLPNTNIVTAIGRMIRPDSVMLAPKP